MRHRGFRSARLQITNHKPQIPQRGYMMITLMLALALITLALLAVLPSMKQQIMRDREQEMMHRANSYMRAIQHFYKKFGRYPTRVEDLENTNNLRFLRKRYTDPINIDRVTHKERDFKFLRQQDITLNNGPVLPGQSGNLNSPQSGLSSFGTPLGGTQTGAGAQTSPSGDSASSSSPGSSATGGAASGNAASGNAADEENANKAASSSSNPTSGPNPNGQTFGGGPILGVASTSKHKTIRVFFDKNHYNDWFFIYVPGADLAGLLTGPINPNMPSGSGLIPPGTGQTGPGAGFGGQSPILQPAPQAPTPQGPQQ